MGCFFCCFRARENRRSQINLVYQPITAIPKEPVDSSASNRLYSVLVPEDEHEDTDHWQSKEGRYDVVGSPDTDKELRAEAKFLKACGTLPQTPTEIRNAEKLKDPQSHNGDEESIFYSCLPNTITEKESEEQPDQVHSPIKRFEEWGNISDWSSHSPNRCTTRKNTNSESTFSSEGSEVEHAVKDTQALDSSTSCTPMVASMQSKNKSVRFERQTDEGSLSSSSSSAKHTNQNLKPSGSLGDQSALRPSPYPTPLRITDDMQTPGTVFPAYIFKEIGKNPRIRLQYAYSGVHPETFSQLEARVSSNQSFFSSEESPEQSDEGTPQSSASEEEVNRSATFASWLPPKSGYEGCKDRYLVPISEGLPDLGETPGDGLLLGMVNGIPNTTNKYKEDQKVSWHATPFEERLEKALSEDNKFTTERKQIGETSAIEF